jgi:signal transduction histidine kinase
MNERTARWRTVLAGVGGCLLIAAVQSTSRGGGFSPRIGVVGFGWYIEPDPVAVMVPAAATVLALCLLRWWPYLLAAGGLLCVPVALDPALGMWFSDAFGAAFPLLVVGTLAAAQSLWGSGAPGAGAAVAGLAISSGLFGHVVPDPRRPYIEPALSTWRVVLVVAGVAAVASVVWWWRGDPAAIGPRDLRTWEWKRIRLVLVGGLVTLAPVPFVSLTEDQLADLLDVWEGTLFGNPDLTMAITGGMTLAAALALSIVLGPWPVAGSLAAAITQVAVAVPMFVALRAAEDAGPARWFGAGLGVAIGAAAVVNRWRTVAAVTLTVGAAICVFVAHTATSGVPEKLAFQHRITPAVLMLGLSTAAVTAVVGATTPVLAPRGAIPAVLGPITAVIVVAGVRTVPVAQQRKPYAVASLGRYVHLDNAATMLLVGAAAIGGLGLAYVLFQRWAERKRAELIRQEAAAAERDRLARPIHDGVLQVLALVQREGSELGGSGAQLAALAGEQEAALRTLLGGDRTNPGTAAEADLRATLTGLSSPAVDVSAPADPVTLPAGPAADLTAAVQAALDNVRRHAGPGARAWILLEDEGDGVRVTVRDNGVGFESRRLDEAARAGRLGVVQSIRGRIRDLGGTTTIKSRPGKGTEVELWVPRRS